METTFSRAWTLVTESIFNDGNGFYLVNTNCYAFFACNEKFFIKIALKVMTPIYSNENYDRCWEHYNILG